MSDLFADAARERMQEIAPLALRLRPRSLDEFVGQRAGARRRLGAAARDRGGPRRVVDPLRAAGHGQDDARAHRRGDDRRGLRGALGRLGIRDGRARGLARARDRLGGNGQRTILFLDEIHRFNKAQQDALLPAVEEGLVTLIGATTENPYFEVNSALLSRCQIYELEPLGEASCG
jgi:putative ATPase